MKHLQTQNKPNRRSREIISRISRDEDIANDGVNVNIDVDVDVDLDADMQVHETANRNLLGDYENCWVQVGNDISGSASLKAFGVSVDLSSIVSHNSTESVMLATGAYGYAMVFNYTFGDGDIYDGEWTQLGDRLAGKQQYDDFGHSISLSSDGTIMAVGAPFYDTNNRTDNGYVRVYRYGPGSGDASTSWTQIGQDINGYRRGETFGHSINLSDDGLTIIIGTNYLGFALTRVFRYDELNGQTWNLLGEPIEGTDECDGSGSSTSISGDGQIIAIGAPSRSNTRIFNFLGNWTQIGGDIDGQIPDRSGGSISLSYNGTIVAIGSERDDENGIASGHVRIYSFNNTSDEWDQLGSDINGEKATDYSGSCVSLSDDSLTVAIGAWSNDDNGPDAGHVRVYRYESNQWNQYGYDIDGSGGGDHSGGSLSLSSDGQLLAIGSRGHNNSKGHVRIFANTNKNCDISSTPSSLPTYMPSQSPSLHPSYMPSKSHPPSAVPLDQPSQPASKSPTQSPNKPTTQSPIKSPTQPSDPSQKTPQDNEAYKISILICMIPFVVGITTMLV